MDFNALIGEMANDRMAWQRRNRDRMSFNTALRRLTDKQLPIFYQVFGLPVSRK